MSDATTVQSGGLDSTAVTRGIDGTELRIVDRATGSVELGAITEVASSDDATVVRDGDIDTTVLTFGPRGPMGLPGDDSAAEDFTIARDTEGRVDVITFTLDSATKTFTRDGEGRVATVAHSRYGWLKTFSRDGEGRVSGVTVTYP